MSEFKGTKGKWEVSIDSHEDYTITSKGYYLAEARIKEDALLISKAPEMLEMLEKMKMIMDEKGYYSVSNEIKQLIKEATEI